MKPRIRILFRAGYYRIVLSGPSVARKGFRFFQILVLCTIEAAQDWLSRLRGMNRRSTLALVKVTGRWVR